MSTNKPASGLGRGLQALLGEAAVPSAQSGEAPAPRAGVREIEIGRIRPNPEQPRAQFREEAIDELADSISQRGVLQPILLRPHGDGFEIVAGERRWRAAQRARLHTIPALVREIDDSTAAEIALIENIQREDLNAIEEAEGYRQLIEKHAHTQDGVAKLHYTDISNVFFFFFFAFFFFWGGGGGGGGGFSFFFAVLVRLVLTLVSIVDGAVTDVIVASAPLTVLRFTL